MIFSFSSSNAIDCRWDKDCQNNFPFHISLDHNKSITWLTVFQDKLDGKKWRRLELQNSFFVKHPKRIRHVIELFKEYYKYRENKTIYYWFDHNSVREDSMKEHSFWDEVFKRLSASGFQTIKKYIGRAPSHKAKYDLMHEMMEEKNRNLARFRINTANNETLINAIK